MQCFRLSHAGLVAERDGAALILDPGDFSLEREISSALTAIATVVGIVITHEHPDHWTSDHITAIRQKAERQGDPPVPIYTTAGTAQALREAGIADATVVRAGDAVRAGDFELEFYGGLHEVLHRSIPRIENIGVRVDGRLAWGGDSLADPPVGMELLGIPIGSPWSNIGQVMDFALAAAPRYAYLTHDGMLSERGRALFTQRVSWCLAQTGGELVELQPADQRLR